MFPVLMVVVAILAVWYGASVVQYGAAVAAGPSPLWGGVGVGVLSVPTGIEPKTIKTARRLRRNMTDGERRLWAELREFRRWYGLDVRRQTPIGTFVVDFAIHQRKLVLELDGEHHTFPDRLSRDAQRDIWLLSEGYKVVRISTGELSNNFEGCIEHILGVLGLMGRTDTPTPNPSPQGGGGP